MSHSPTPNPGSSPVRHPRWVAAAVCLLAMMSTVGMAMPYPILAPIFVGGPVDGFTHWAGWPPEWLMGVALAANPLGILVGNLFIGPLSDRFGRRRVLAVTLVATLLSYGLTAFALGQRWYLLFVLARFVTGLTEGNVAVARALLADMHGQLDRTQAFAWLNACLYMGWLLGPLLGGMSLPLGEPVPFLLAGLALLPSLAVLWVFVPADPPLAASSDSSWRRLLQKEQTLGLLRQDGLLQSVAGLQLCYCIGVNALYEYAPLWMVQELGLDSRGIAWVTAAQCATMTLASVLAGKLPPSASPLRRAALLALCAAVGLVSLSLLQGRWGLAAMVALGLPLALYNAVLPAWMSERFAQHGQGRVMGLLSTVFCLANVVVALTGGLLAIVSARWIMALGGVAAVWAAWRLMNLARRPDAQSAPSAELGTSS